MYATLMIRNSNAPFYFIANKEAMGLDWFASGWQVQGGVKCDGQFFSSAIAFRVLLGGGGGWGCVCLCQLVIFFTCAWST